MIFYKQCASEGCVRQTPTIHAKYCRECRHKICVELGKRLGNLTPAKDRLKRPKIWIRGPFLAAFEDNILASFIEKRPGREHKHQIEFIDRHKAMGREVRLLDRAQLDFAIVEREALGRLVKP
jgi:hypothetical protein